MAKIESFTVEVCGEQNEGLLFLPLAQVLRGRWDFSKKMCIGRAIEEPLRSLSEVGRIPGIQISVDYDRKRIVVFDPLGNKDNAETLQAINGAAQRGEHLFGGSKVRPQETVTMSDCDQDTLKDWMYWIRRALDSKNMTVISGSVGTLDEIKAMPGKRRTNYGTSSNLKEDEMWADVVDNKTPGKPVNA
jgi:hypothetical protein